MSYRPGGQMSGFEGSGSQSPEVYSLIDRYSSIEGTFTSERDLRIEGQMRGNLRCQGLLFIAEGADIDAEVEAANIAVAGSLRGVINCRGKLQIMPTGRVVAAVTTESLVINEGAIFEGELRMETSGAGVSSQSGAPIDDADSTQAMLRRFGSEPENSSPSPGTRRVREE